MSLFPSRPITSSSFAFAALLALGATTALAPSTARALDCGSNNGLCCNTYASMFGLSGSEHSALFNQCMGR